MIRTSEITPDKDKVVLFHIMYEGKQDNSTILKTSFRSLNQAAEVFMFQYNLSSQV